MGRRFAELDCMNALFYPIKPRLAGFVSGIVAFVIMGSFGVLVRHVTAGGAVIASVRFGLGLLFLALYLLLTRQWQAIRVKLSGALLLSGIFLALCVFFYIQAIQRIPLASAVLLLYFAPLAATALAYFVLREPISLLNGLWLWLAFLGSLLLLGVGTTAKGTLTSGHLAGLASALFYALFILANRSISPDLTPAARAFYQLLLGFLVMLPLAGHIDVVALAADTYWLLAIGFLHGFLALFLMISALRHLRAFEYGTLSYFEPIVAALAGYLVYGEGLTAPQLVGGALIIGSGLMQILASAGNLPK